MSSRTDPFDEDEMLFVGAHTVLPSESYRKGGSRVGKRKLQVLMGRHSAPKGWRGNVPVRHCDEGSKNYVYKLTGALECIEGECHCIQCMKREYECIEGPVWSNSKSFPAEDLVERGYVGIYDPKEVESRSVSCGICKEPIRQNGRVSVDLGENEEVVHLDCLSQEEREQLAKIGYRRPYFIRDKEEQVGSPNPEGDGEGECER